MKKYRFVLGAVPKYNSPDMKSVDIYSAEGSFAQLGILEEDMIKISDWCKETGIGRRVAFNTFVFRTDADRLMFILAQS